MTDARGYWIVHLDVSDPEAFKAYQSASAPVFARFGGRFLVRGGSGDTKAGALRSRHVVIEFKDYATALACYESDDYRRAGLLRDATSRADFVVVEGYAGPQPA